MFTQPIWSVWNPKMVEVFLLELPNRWPWKVLWYLSSQTNHQSVLVNMQSFHLSAVGWIMVWSEPGPHFPSLFHVFIISDLLRLEIVLITTIWKIQLISTIMPWICPQDEVEFIQYKSNFSAMWAAGRPGWIFQPCFRHILVILVSLLGQDPCPRCWRPCLITQTTQTIKRSN